MPPFPNFVIKQVVSLKNHLLKVEMGRNSILTVRGSLVVLSPGFLKRRTMYI